MLQRFLHRWQNQLATAGVAAYWKVLILTRMENVRAIKARHDRPHINGVGDGVRRATNVQLLCR